MTKVASMIGRILREQREITLVLILFIGLGILYSATTPLFEGPDEHWHYAFVQHVATGRGLPVQSEQPTHLARQEGSQPPLYYLLAAAATFWIDTSDFPGIVWENPHYGYNVPGVINDNKNLFIHTALESFPYRGAVLAIHLARLVSVVMGALAVLFTYLLALEIFGNKILAAMASAFVAFVPQYIFISSAVSNDSTIVALSALSLWRMVRLLAADHRLPRTRDVIALGIACGLAAIAKVSGVGLFALAALVVVWQARRVSRERNTSVARVAFFNLILLAFAFSLVSGWWYLRNLILYGELTGTAMMTHIFGARETPLALTQLVVQLREVWETFWLGFGWGNIRAHPAVYTTIEVFIALVGVGLLIGVIRRRDKTFRLPLAILLLWVAIMFGALISWMQTTQAPHGRLFFPALPALVVLIAYGLGQFKIHAKRSKFKIGPFDNAQGKITNYEHLHSRRGAVQVLRITNLSFIIFLFALAAIAPFAILQPAYAFPPSLNAGAIPATIRRVEIAYDGKLKLIGYEVAPRRARAGEAVTLTLYWQSLAPMDDDYSIGIHLLDANQRVVGARDSYPGHGLLPTRLWYVGQIIRDPYWVPIGAEASAGAAKIQVALYSRAHKRDLPAIDPAGKAITPIIGQIKIASANPVVPRVQQSTDYSFGKQIALIGYDLKPAQDVLLTLYWKRLAPIQNDYTVFVHVLDANGKIVAQKDQQPDSGNNPTSLWDDGEVVIDAYALTLPVAARGNLQIKVGVYNSDAGERLSAADGRGNALGDSVMLGSFEVGR